MTTSAPRSSPDFSTRLAAALRDHSPRRRHLVGVSGGCDSMVLLHGLHTLGYRKLVVCHLDHGLRGAASRADARLVERAARQLDLPAESARADVRAHAAAHQQSTELAARELRYAFFEAAARKHRCTRLFLAHHADDQVETILFNFLRGTGPAGLSGMKTATRRGRLEIFRPLLAFTRAEIETQAAAEKIPFREDASNRDPAHTRNRLRHEVLPVLENVMGRSFRAALLRAGEIFREENAFIEAQVPPVGETLSCRELKALAPALQRRVVRQWLQDRQIAEAGWQETQRVLSLLNDGDGPAKVNLPGNRHARRRMGKIFLESA